MQLRELNVGDYVLIAGGFGMETPRKAVITEVSSDIKNGRPGVEYVEVGTGQERWAYLTQIKRRWDR